MGHLLKVDWQKAMTFQRILLVLGVVFIPTSIQFFLVRTGYSFYRPVEVHTEVVGGMIALLFPLFFIMLYANSFAVERKDNFIEYTKVRTRLRDYILAKAIVNAGLVFGTAFAMVFLSFVFLVYVEPLLGLLTYESRGLSSSTTSIGTFEVLLSYGTLTYGIVYSIWVALNAVLYATLAFMLTLLIKNTFLALSLPFLWYFILNFVAGVLGYPEFSTTSTIFPFNITEQPIWTIFVPFLFNGFVLTGLIIYLKTTYEENVYEYTS